MSKLSIQHLALSNNKVLVRVDFNVPLDEHQHITDDTRIKAALPTIQYLLDHGCSVVLMSHLGRPKGRTPELSLAPCAKALSKLLHKNVLLAPDCIGPEVETLVSELKQGDVILLENLRFHPEEEKPEENPSFVKSLASLGDIYVNDAFGTAHRAHASTALIAKYFPGKAAAGFLMQKEIEFLGSVLSDPRRPFHAIIGGAKISSKLGVIQSLIQKVDALYIGGGMAFTFMKAQGLEIGNSICENDLIATAKEIIEECKIKSLPLLLPIDLCIADGFYEDVKSEIIDTDKGIPQGYQGMDVGPNTLKQWAQELQKAKTVFWNGPIGVAELLPFSKGTLGLAKALSALDAITIVGGGDSVAALQSSGLTEKFDHVSTGGGASLEYIEFGKLPGVEALTDA